MLHDKIQNNDISRIQRYLNKPQLSALFSGDYKKTQRNKGIYIAHVEHGYKMKGIADYLEVHYTTVSKALKNEERK